jgi:hypothetical protein
MDKLLYPTEYGRLDSSETEREDILLIWGCEIIEGVARGLIFGVEMEMQFETTTRYMEDFVQFFYGKKNETKATNRSLSNTYKRCLNSYSGKLG